MFSEHSPAAIFGSSLCSGFHTRAFKLLSKYSAAMSLRAPEEQAVPQFPHFISAVDAVRGLTIKGPSPKPRVADRRSVPRDIGMADLPLVPCGDEANNVVAFCDVIMEVCGPLDAKTLFEVCEKGQWSGLPEPLAPKHPLNVPYTMQIFIAVDDPGAVLADSPDGYTGKYHVCKHYTLHGGTIAVNRIKNHCHGKAMRFEYGQFCRLGGAAVQHLFHQLHGLQVTSYEVGPRCERKALVSSDRAARDKGYKHIRDKGPRSNNENKFMGWADHESHDEQSHAYGWPEVKTVTALANYAKGGANAKPMTYWPFTLNNVVAWLLNDILSLMLGSLRQHSIVWLGKTRTGKSAVSNIVAMTQTDFEISQEENPPADATPGMLTAKHMDFFKAQPITKRLAGIFDDGLLQKQQADVLKAFLNPSEEDATTWARWGSSTFDMGSCRQACNNPYCEMTEARAVKASKDQTITHEEFVALISPSFSSITEPADMDAILARGHCIVLTEEYIFWCVATPDHPAVKFMKWPNPEKRDLLSEATRPAWKTYKNNPHSGALSDDHTAGMVWSREYIGKLTRGEAVPKIATVSGFPSFSSFPGRSSPTIQLVPRMMSETELGNKIKTEKEKAWSRRMLKMSGAQFDISGEEVPSGPGASSSSNDAWASSHAASAPEVVQVKRDRVDAPIEPVTVLAGEVADLLGGDHAEEPAKRQRMIGAPLEIVPELAWFKESQPEVTIKHERLTEFHAAALKAHNEVVSLLDDDLDETPLHGGMKPDAAPAAPDDAASGGEAGVPAVIDIEEDIGGGYDPDPHDALAADLEQVMAEDIQPVPSATAQRDTLPPCDEEDVFGFGGNLD